jgi:hypothetical protein
MAIGTVASFLSFTSIAYTFDANDIFITGYKFETLQLRGPDWSWITKLPK